MLALAKPTGGARALVMGDIFRCLVARTLGQQFGEAFRTACAPFQYALSTTATKADPRTTVLSIDGLVAYATIMSCETG